jgi:hypothetical protein
MRDPSPVNPFYPDNGPSQATPRPAAGGPNTFPWPPKGRLAEGGDWPYGLKLGRLRE